MAAYFPLLSSLESPTTSAKTPRPLRLCVRTTIGESQKKPDSAEIWFSRRDAEDAEFHAEISFFTLMRPLAENPENSDLGSSHFLPIGRTAKSQLCGGSASSASLREDNNRRKPKNVRTQKSGSHAETQRTTIHASFRSSETSAPTPGKFRRKTARDGVIVQIIYKLNTFVLTKPNTPLILTLFGKNLIPLHGFRTALSESL